MIRGAAIALVVSGIAAAAGQQAPVFKSKRVSVSVYTTVKQGNKVIANLTASDFRLTDNGVPQTVEAVSIESVPIDVTLFLDTSGSTAGKLDEMKRDVQGIVKFLRPGDKFRLLTIGDSVYEAVHWVPAGTTEIDLSFGPVGGISLIQDALAIHFCTGRSQPASSHRRGGSSGLRRGTAVVLRELAARSGSAASRAAGRRRAIVHRARTCSPAHARRVRTSSAR